MKNLHELAKVTGVDVLELETALGIAPKELVISELRTRHAVRHAIKVFGNVSGVLHAILDHWLQNSTTAEDAKFVFQKASSGTPVRGRALEELKIRAEREIELATESQVVGEILWGALDGADSKGSAIPKLNSLVLAELEVAVTFEVTLTLLGRSLSGSTSASAALEKCFSFCTSSADFEQVYQHVKSGSLEERRLFTQWIGFCSNCIDIKQVWRTTNRTEPQATQAVEKWESLTLASVLNASSCEEARTVFEQSYAEGDARRVALQKWLIHCRTFDDYKIILGRFVDGSPVRLDILRRMYELF